MGLDSIFGTPNKYKADAAQKDIEHSQRSRGNQLHNIETVSKQYKELAIRKHAKRYSENVYNAGIKAQGKVFKTAEHLARIKAPGGSVAEGGRRRTCRRGCGRSNE